MASKAATLKVSKKVQVPLMWPTTVSHRIDVSSPLYGFSPEQLADSKMEVVDSIEPSIFAGLIHQYLHPLLSFFEGDCECGWRARVWGFHRQQDELHWQRDCLGSQVFALESAILVQISYECL